MASRFPWDSGGSTSLFGGGMVVVKFLIILFVSVLVVLAVEITLLTSADVRDTFKAAKHAKS